MNKKGFTLVEILAVIVLLGVIIAIAVPAITAMRRNILEKEDADQINSLESAAIYYAQDHEKNEIDVINYANGLAVTTYPINVTVEQLLSEGYIEPTVKSNGTTCTYSSGCLIRPSDNSIINSKVIIVSKTNNKLKAEYQE